MTTTLDCNLQVKRILRAALEFGTLKQCLEASMVCHDVEAQGYRLSRTEERLHTRLLEKIDRLKTASNDSGEWHVLDR